MSTSCESIAGLVIKKDATVGDFMERETTHVAKQAQFNPKWLKINDLTRMMEYCSQNFGHPCTECETNCSKPGYREAGRNFGQKCVSFGIRGSTYGKSTILPEISGSKMQNRECTHLKTVAMRGTPHTSMTFTRGH